ncbi:DUF397 domain-containing protein [Streptomyces sp. NBC_00690]|uniref:DUF397 domain-containing protein n=1 Tax=Streptomyces sp. NBC_00690 TaxID=2975808 RepID=UPI002E2813F9|nr:DUF397 domain-containing protein [Streptomyces sp. NBC_00690]
MKITFDRSALISWDKSSYSGGEGQCIEWSPSFAVAHGVVPVRDSKAPAGPVLMLSPQSWAGLVAIARSSGE